MKIKMLSDKFFDDYPQNDYPEIEIDNMRPYIIIVFKISTDLYLCTPFRSNINHKNGYLFKNSIRSQNNNSGIDFSKSLIIKNEEYIGDETVVDKDEHSEMILNISMIKENLMEYLSVYINHHKGIKKIHDREYMRKYKYTTLQYFHNLLDI
ncbi:type III toxin-antitoxin system TenpIN family toxin [Haploplasma modicum]|uniref:type III toxin-antitoxin system TenpIN family toxin n=1 Tax=Haploplasma modicum TaxID=2150 RepID=UPI00055459EA|nr:hypothetical protein [Haploplasma modicum]MCR1808799.1 hypothetical protein [Haploplasma modicum]